MNWVIGDVHGCIIEPTTLLREIKFNSSRDTVTFVGDFVDRGPYGREVFEFVRNGCEHGYFFAVRGNHDDQWFQAVRDGAEDMVAEQYPETWESFGGRSGIVEFASWVETLPVVIETESAIIVHGGMESDRHIRQQDDQTLLWTRNTEFIPSEYRDNKIVVHGHTPVAHPVVLPDRINIDTGCVFGGQLTALSLDALENGEIVWKSVSGLKLEEDVS